MKQSQRDSRYRNDRAAESYSRDHCVNVSGGPARQGNGVLLNEYARAVPSTSGEYQGQAR